MPKALTMTKELEISIEIAKKARELGAITARMGLRRDKCPFRNIPGEAMERTQWLKGWEEAWARRSR